MSSRQKLRALDTIPWIFFHPENKLLKICLKGAFSLPLILPAEEIKTYFQCLFVMAVCKEKKTSPDYFQGSNETELAIFGDIKSKLQANSLNFSNICS